MSRLLQIAAAYTIVQGMSGLAILDRALYGEWDGKGGDKLTQLLNVVSICTSFFLLFMGRRRFGPPPLRMYFPFAAVGLLVASAVWSQDPPGTTRVAVNYAIMVVGAMGMAQALRPLEIMRVTVWVCAIAAIASLAAYPTSLGVLPNPTSGVTDFRGIFGLKNMLGEAMVAGVPAALYCITAEVRGRAGYILLTTLFVAMTLAAKSATSFVICLGYLTLFGILLLHARGGSARVLSYCGLAVAGIAMTILAIAPDLGLEALGKDPTLTGRTELWPYVIDPITQKLLFGWGFHGFWMMSNPAAMSISDAVGWYVPEAHNGALEFLLQVGIVGTVLFAVLLARNFWLAMQCMRRGDRDLGRAALLFLVGLLMMSVSEAILLTPSQIPTLQFFLFGFMCEFSLRAVSQRRQVAVPPLRRARAAAMSV